MESILPESSALSLKVRSVVSYCFWKLKMEVPERLQIKRGGFLKTLVPVLPREIRGIDRALLLHPPDELIQLMTPKRII